MAGSIIIIIIIASRVMAGCRIMAGSVIMAGYRLMAGSVNYGRFKNVKLRQHTQIRIILEVMANPGKAWKLPYGR